MIDPSMAEPYFNLGNIHEHGLGCERDMKGAYQYYKKAARLNHAESISKCGDFLYSGKVTGGVSDRQEAMRCYRKAAEMSCPTALNSLGLMIESTNFEEAIELYREAHKMGNLDATINFALALFKTDKAASRALLSFAVKKGHARAIDYMVDMGFLESCEIQPQVIDQEDLKILEGLDAVPYN